MTSGEVLISDLPNELGNQPSTVHPALASLKRRVARVSSLNLDPGSSVTQALQDLSDFTNRSDPQLKANVRTILDTRLLSQHQTVAQHLRASEKALQSLLSSLDVIDAEIEKALSDVASQRANQPNTELWDAFEAAEARANIIETLLPTIVPSESTIATLRSGEIDMSWFSSYAQLLTCKSNAENLSKQYPNVPPVLASDALSIIDQQLANAQERIGLAVARQQLKDSKISYLALSIADSASVEEYERVRGIAAAERIRNYCEAVQEQQTANPVAALGSVLSEFLEILSGETSLTTIGPEKFLVNLVSSGSFFSPDAVMTNYGAWEAVQVVLDRTEYSPSEGLRVAKLLEVFSSHSTPAISALAMNASRRMRAKAIERAKAELVGLVIPGNLSAPPELIRSGQLIEDIVKVDELAEDEGLETLGADCFVSDDAIANLCECVLHAINELKAQRNSHVFALNCLSVLLGSASNAVLSPALHPKAHQLLVAAEAEHLDALIEISASESIARIGLDCPASSVALAAVIRGFYASLFTMGVSAVIPQHLEFSLQNKRHFTIVRKRIAEAIAGAYEDIFVSIGTLGIAPHTPAEVRLLLDL